MAFWGRLGSLVLVLLCFGLPGWARVSGEDPRVVKSLCGELLTNPEMLAAVAVEGAPGLRILATELYGTKPNYENLRRSDSKAFHTHELISSARYAKYISAKSGETVLMVPGIEHKDIPGFDGVIFDADGKPVANYSLKTLISATSESAAMDRAQRGVHQAQRFSFIEQWLITFKLLLKDESGALHIARDLHDRELRRAKVWLRKSLRVFGIAAPSASKRPTRVVVDIQTEVGFPGPEQVQTMQGWVRDSHGLIESIIFIKGADVLDVR
jgi:hypothetical protein